MLWDTLVGTIEKGLLHLIMAVPVDQIVVDGNTLTIDGLMSIGPKTQLLLSDAAWEAVRKSRKVVDDIVSEGRTVYGINTGFGNFSEVVIPPAKLNLLQENLIRSHAAGVGPAMTADRTKRLLALRINVLAKGMSQKRPSFCWLRLFVFLLS